MPPSVICLAAESVKNLSSNCHQIVNMNVKRPNEVYAAHYHVNRRSLGLYG